MSRVDVADLRTTATSMARAGVVFVYRYFDTAGNLLYIGISSDPAARLATHRRSRAWAAAVASIELEVHADRAAAEIAEVVAISTELPRYNRMHHPDPLDDPGPYARPGRPQPSRVAPVAMGQEQKQDNEHGYPTVVEAMVMADISDYAERAHGQKVTLTALRRFHNAGEGGLPAPKAVFSGRPVWERATIDEWLRTRRRGGGRPAARPAQRIDLEALKRDDPEAYEQLLAEARAGLG